MQMCGFTGVMWRTISVTLWSFHWLPANLKVTTWPSEKIVVHAAMCCFNTKVFLPIQQRWPVKMVSPTDDGRVLASLDRASLAVSLRLWLFNNLWKGGVAQMGTKWKMNDRERQKKKKEKSSKKTQKPRKAGADWHNLVPRIIWWYINVVELWGNRDHPNKTEMNTICNGTIWK